MKAILLTPFIVLAAIGLILSLIAHGCALLGLPQPLGGAAWGLHVGIFVVWLPAFLVSARLVRDFKQEDFWKAALRGCPKWTRWMTYGFFIYAIINFITFRRWPWLEAIRRVDVRTVIRFRPPPTSARIVVLRSSTPNSVTPMLRMRNK